ncbi:cytochrome P450 [Hypoxylon sp. NC1633]|nr:cytochrome P450 [Hypoxylon sp. NC1633]
MLDYLRLSDIPGPFFAGFTDLWRFCAQNSRGYSTALLALHRKYGKLVRIGPNHVSVSDPDAVALIYGSNPVWVKRPSYYAATSVSQGRTMPSIVGMGEAQKAAVHRAVGRAFTTNSLLDYERLLQGPLAARLKKSSDSPLGCVALGKLEARRLSPDQLERQDLCQKFLEGQAKYPQAVLQDELLGTILSIIGAGADTTGTTLTYVFFLLAKHPVAKEKLQYELDDAFRTGTLSRLPRWAEVNKLPYLEAVLRESMRVLPIAAWGFDRIVPAEGASIAGKLIPAGTVVGCQIDTIHQDPYVYGNDASAFRPERWLEAGEEQKRTMDRAFLAFGAGKRICLGRHIAWLKMKKTLPLLLKNFDFHLLNPDQKLEEGIRISAVKYAPPIWIRVVKRQADMRLEVETQ